MVEEKTVKFLKLRYLSVSVFLIIVIGGTLWLEIRKYSSRSEISSLKTSLSVVNDENGEIRKIRLNRENFFFKQLLLTEPLQYVNCLIRTVNLLKGDYAGKFRPLRIVAENSNGICRYRAEYSDKSGNEEKLKQICVRVNEDGDLGVAELRKDGNLYIIEGEVEL